LGFVREESPAPYEIELVHLVQYTNGKGDFFIAYPSDNRRFPAPGMFEPVELTRSTKSDPLWTLFLAPQRYIRVFKGTLDKSDSIKKHPNGEDFLSWNNSNVRNFTGTKVLCWVSYAMAKDNRVVGLAHPSKQAFTREVETPSKRSTSLPSELALEAYSVSGRLPEGVCWFTLRNGSRVYLFNEEGEPCGSLKVSGSTMRSLGFRSSFLYKGIVSPAQVPGVIFFSSVESSLRFDQIPKLADIGVIIQKLAT